MTPAARSQLRPLGIPLLLLGLAIVLIELGRYWWTDHPIHPMPVVIGGVIALFGAYVTDPRATTGGGEFVTGIAERGARVLAFWRTGRRAEDVAAVMEDGSVRPIGPAARATTATQVVHVDPMELPPPTLSHPPSEGER